MTTDLVLDTLDENAYATAAEKYLAEYVQPWWKLRQKKSNDHPWGRELTSDLQRFIQVRSA